ncbi:Gfo/Idh/MocA family protein [Yinghuangia aomiensis]
MVRPAWSSSGAGRSAGGGSGRWLRTRAPTWSPWWTPTPKRPPGLRPAAGMAEVPWFRDLESALDVAADIAVNTTPAPVHAGVSAAALARGLHVFSEKPLALRLDDAADLVAAAQARQLVLAVMANRGLDRRFLAVRDLVHAQGPGPYAVTAGVFVRLPDAGFRGDLAAPATADLAVHAFDQVRQIVAAPPVRVWCTETTLRWLGPHCSVAALTVEFADASVPSFHGGFTTGAACTSPDGQWRIDMPGAGIVWDGGGTAVLVRPDTIPRTAVLPDSGGHAAQITAMVDAVHGGRELPDPLGSVALLDAALLSASTGRPVDIGPRWQS